MVDSEKLGEKERVIVSRSLIKFDARTYLYNPRFDLGIGEEWLPKCESGRKCKHLDAAVRSQ